MGRIVLTVDSRITLKQYCISDSKTIFELIDGCRKHLNQHGENTAEKYPTIKSVRDSIAYPKNPKRLRFGIWDKNVFVGTINITPNEDTEGNPVAEIGYFLGERYQRQGYIEKSIVRLIQYAFYEMGVQMVYAVVSQGNIRSANILIKAGFQKEISSDDLEKFYLEKSISINKK